MSSAAPVEVLWVGIGCQRGTSRSVIEQAIQAVFRENCLAESAIAGIATIDTKSSEAGLIEFCRDRSLPLRCFAAARLEAVTVPHPSSAVMAAMGVPSVAEAAALLASWEVNSSGAGEQETADFGVSAQSNETQRRREAQNFLLRSDTCTRAQLWVPKQVFRVEGQSGAVTVAIAEALSRG